MRCTYGYRWLCVCVCVCRVCALCPHLGERQWRLLRQLLQLLLQATHGLPQRRDRTRWCGVHRHNKPSWSATTQTHCSLSRVRVRACALDGPPGSHAAQLPARALRPLRHTLDMVCRWSRQETKGTFFGPMNCLHVDCQGQLFSKCSFVLLECGCVRGYVSGWMRQARQPKHAARSGTRRCVALLSCRCDCVDWHHC